jgi:peptide deformylase
MLKNKDIIDEKDKRLREISKEVKFPLSDEDRKNIDLMIEYLTNSQIEELAEKYDLRPGMGLSAIQIGVPKRYFVVVYEYDEGKFDNYIIINPKIVSNSMEKIYVELGEGCLSVNREVDGIVPRYARVTIEGYDMDGNKIRVRGREELAIAFQHELDHLNGILFYDHIDPKNPYKDQNKYRAI